MSEVVDIETIPVLYLALGSLQSFLMSHTELVWPLLVLLIGLWFFGVYGQIYGAVIDSYYAKKEVNGTPETAIF